MWGIKTIAVALVLTVVTGAAAQQVHTGNVLRTDPPAGVVVFQDGRMFQTTADTVMISNNQRVFLSSLQTGTNVTLYAAQPVVLRDGRYVALSESGARAATGTVTTVPPGGPATAVVPPPATAVVVTSPPAVTIVEPSRVAADGPVFEVRGNLSHVLLPDGKIQFLDGRRILVTDDTQVLLNGVQHVPLSMLATFPAGTLVVVRSLRPFAQTRRETVPLTEVARGTIVRVDAPGVIVLSDGRTVRTVPETVVLVAGRPTAVTAVQRGQSVVIFQNGMPMVVTEVAVSPAFDPQAGVIGRLQNQSP